MEHGEKVTPEVSVGTIACVCPLLSSPTTVPDASQQRAWVQHKLRCICSF